MTQSELQKTLQRLNADFEANNFEQMNADERTQAPTRVIADRTGLRQHVNVGNSQYAGLRAESVGLLSVKVTRNSANIACALPYIIFGKNDYDAGYISTMQQLLSNPVVSIAITSFTVTNVNGNVRFTFNAAGPLTDTVDVSLSGNINYVAFLSSMAQNFFKFRFMQATISDENQSGTQFSYLTQFGELSSLGKQATDTVVLADMVDSSAYRKDKAELVVPEQGATPSFSYASFITNVSAFSFTHGFFMSFRENLNKLGNR